MLQTVNACPQADGAPLRGDLDALLNREWLLTDGRGGFAMGTVLGCPTRRYHGMMIASRRPPLERFLLLAGTLERVAIQGRTVDLSTAQFASVTHPTGYTGLKNFDYCPGGSAPWVQWTFTHPQFEARKRLTLHPGSNVVHLRYEITSSIPDEFELEVLPLLAMRDFHGLQRGDAIEPWEMSDEAGGLWVRDRSQPDVTLAMFPQRGAGLEHAALDVQPSWWRDFHYRAEVERGEPGTEDLICAGVFRAAGSRTMAVELVGVGMAASMDQARSAAERAFVRAGTTAQPRRSPRDRGIRQRLREAAEQFVVRRQTVQPDQDVTIIAGYPWFGDWGRDAFIALEGLLLARGRFSEARKVLATFAGAERHGLIPNRFDDYGGQCAYNSVDASLWFIHAADRYSSLSGDEQVWAAVLAKPCRNIVDGFVQGTLYDIRVDERGLVSCGNAHTQITWMDALCDGVAFTPRHGCPVEVNALWHHALRILGRRLIGVDDQTARRCQRLAEQVTAEFAPAFWNEDGGYLYDCVRGDFKDASIRPNQIFAVSLAEDLLSEEKQRAVLDTVTRHLLTPFGLRSLAAHEPGYCPRMVGTRFERDRTYHNGTVWSWLIGPYVDAALRVHGRTAESVDHLRRTIAPLLGHLTEAGLGTISEVFDGDAPHAPRGCIAQAWSVAELLRIMTQLDSVSGAECHAHPAG
ncbi:MAG: glycogen debranching protein [bacterium]|nr:glycogen debranching protein [bacterium]